VKYFDELTNVENQVIRLVEMRRLLAVIVNGLDGSSEEEVNSAINHIRGSIDDISEKLSDNFQLLFDTIATDDIRPGND
jgi:acetolactate synthase small subunit